MVTLYTRDDSDSLWLIALEMVLPRHLERRLHRLRTAVDKIDVVEPAWCGAGEIFRQSFRGLVGEKTRVRIREMLRLSDNGPRHHRVPVAQTRDRGAAAGVDVAPAIGANELYPPPPRRHRAQGPGGAL